MPKDKPAKPVARGEFAEGAGCDSDPTAPPPVSFPAAITPWTVGTDEIRGAGLPAVGLAVFEEETAELERRRTASKNSDATSRVRFNFSIPIDKLPFAI